MGARVMDQSIAACLSPRFARSSYKRFGLGVGEGGFAVWDAAGGAFCVSVSGSRGG
jgi:hypothetical protein